MEMTGTTARSAHQEETAGSIALAGAFERPTTLTLDDLRRHACVSAEPFDLRCFTTNRFIRAVGAPFRIGVHELHQTACVGLTLYPQDARDPDVLLKNADLALSRAKLEGSGACVLYRHELHLRAMERNSIQKVSSRLTLVL